MSSLNYKEELDGLIMRALSDGASDLHFAVGRYPTFRVLGNLAPLMNMRVLTAEDTKGLLNELI